ncbi:hypothetical protein FRB90_008035 [Tulasnella sp. 427]|nr:hypothetical protein FRB90_008035 [Tulasnella sp. 427]
MADAEEIIINLNSTYFPVAVGGLYIGVGLFPEEPPIQYLRDSIEWMGSGLGKARLPVHLHLREIALPPGPLFLPPFDREIRVTKLTIYWDPYFGPAFDAFIPLLAQPLQSESSEPRWILPHLGVLDTNQVFDGPNTAVLDVVRSRNSTSTSDGPEQPADRPNRLREIRLDYGRKSRTSNQPPDREFMTAMLEAANGADVYWQRVKWTVESMHQKVEDEQELYKVLVVNTTCQ